MQTCVNVYKLRPNIRYTFTDKYGNQYRAKLDKYQSANGVSRQAIRLIDVEGVDGFLCMPISYIKTVNVFVLPTNIPYFQYLIPEVSMIINQCI